MEFVLLKKVYNTIKKYNMIQKDDGIVVAFSGGPDSVSLFSLLLALREKIAFKLYALHVHHGLRGEDADIDADFSRKFSKTFNVPFWSVNKDVLNYAKINRLSFEEAGRIIRKKVYKDSLKYFNANKVATGHTKDDQAETILMRIIMGTGAKGLAGIYPVCEGYIIRPLIDLYKKELIEYLNINKISYRVDKTNEDTDYFRNRVRHLLIPFLKDNFNLRIEESLSNMAIIFQRESRYINSKIESFMDSEVIKKRQKFIVSLDSLKALPYFLRSMVVREIVREIKGDLKDISFSHTESLLMLLNKNTSSKLELPAGIKARISYEKFIIYKNKEDKEENILLPSPSIISLPGISILRDWRLIIRGEILDYVPSLLSTSSNTVYFDFDKIEKGDFVLRSRKPGDRFRPFGMKGFKKIKEFFIDEKIPKKKRDFIPILEHKGKIVWILGIRASDLFRVREMTERVLKIQIEFFEGDEYV